MCWWWITQGAVALAVSSTTTRDSPNDDALIGAHIVQLEYTVRSLHHPDAMALPSGIYTIQNVEYRNWAMLFDGNEGEVVSVNSPHANVGEKVRTLET
jgi:hypothetical protein